ncbi:hypothetical protein KUCAC02_010259, partial [Chaenocephalus aceratus]
CRYVVLKIRAAVRGEPQTEKRSTTCSQARQATPRAPDQNGAPKEGQMDSRMSRDGSALIPNPTQSGEVLQKEECGS